MSQSSYHLLDKILPSVCARALCHILVPFFLTLSYRQKEEEENDEISYINRHILYKEERKKNRICWATE